MGLLDKSGRVKSTAHLTCAFDASIASILPGQVQATDSFPGERSQLSARDVRDRGHDYSS